MCHAAKFDWEPSGGAKLIAQTTGCRPNCPARRRVSAGLNWRNVATAGAALGGKPPLPTSQPSVTVLPLDAGSPPNYPANADDFDVLPQSVIGSRRAVLGHGADETHETLIAGGA